VGSSGRACDLVENSRTVLDLPQPYERDADVVFRVADPLVAGLLPRLERCERVGEAALGHQHLGREHLPLLLEILRQRTGDAPSAASASG
jgi:hypothetical protein